MYYSIIVSFTRHGVCYSIIVSFTRHGVRSVEDMKDRYYSIQYRLDKLQDSEAEAPAHSLYDADHER